MMIIGCDFHPSWQQVSWVDTETGETGERKLVQASGDAERFYRQLPAPALIGMEATGNCHPVGKTALMNGSTLTKAFVYLPGGGTAIYNSSGLAYYRHSDHLGSSRLTSTQARGLYSSQAYAPFGEQYTTYPTAGSLDPSYTGQNSDAVSSLYDFTFREHSMSQGRWISPDPLGVGAVDPTNPQTWNRYAYVANNPLSFVDPLGLQLVFDDDGCVWDEEGDTSDNGVTDTFVGCASGGGGTTVSGRGGLSGGVGGGVGNRIPANNGTPQQTARQKCLSQTYNAPEGKAVQFLSLVSLTPLNPNWKANWGEWGVALFGKGGGMFGSGIGTDTGIQTLNGVQNVGSWLETTTSSVLKVGEEVAPFAMAGAALLDLAIQAQCALDPSAPPEGIPIAPK